VSGTFKNPKTGPLAENVSGRVAAAAALGTLAGPLALIPFLDFGGGEDSDCAALLRSADEHSKQRASPNPIAKLMSYDALAGQQKLVVSF
jgi:hypothetical protein